MAKIRVGILDWLVRADTKGFDKDLKGTEKKAKGFGASLTKIGALGAAAFGVVLAAGVAKLGKALILSGSEAEETGNKFNVVFQDVAQEAEAAGQRIKDEFKLSDQNTQKFLSQVGDITTGLGATAEEALLAAETITTLGLDIDSFANLAGGAEQAVSALTSLFTGEREAAKALGIVINDTNLKKYAEDTGLVFKELTQLEKGFLSLELAQTQSTLAIGDFARSADSFANRMRAAQGATQDLAAELGRFLLPAASTAVGVFGQLTRALAAYAKEQNDNRDANASVDTGLGDLQKTLSNYKGRLDEVNKILADSDDATSAADAGNRLLRSELEDGIEVTRLRIKLQKEDAAALKVLTDEAGNFARAEADVAETKKRNDALAIDAAELLKGLRFDALEPQERQIALLQEQINFWAALENVVGASEIVDILAGQRDALREGNDVLKERVDIVQTQTEVDALFRQAQADASQRQLDDTEEQNQLLLDQTKLYTDLAEIGVGALLAGFEDIGAALAAGELGWDDFAKAGLNAISAVLQALGSQLAAMASLAIVQAATGINVGATVGIGPALLGSAGAFAASGLVKGLAGSFEQGGIIPQPPGVPATGDNMLARVNPGERIVPGDEAGGETVFNFMFNDGVFAKAVVEGNINKGIYTIDVTRGLRG